MQVPRSINALRFARCFRRLQRVKICVEPSLKLLVRCALNVKAAAAKT